MTEMMHMMVEMTRNAGESKSSANWVDATPNTPIGYAIEVQGSRSYVSVPALFGLTER